MPCSASIIRDIKRSSITLKKNSARTFQRAIDQGSTPPPTSSKWGIKMHRCRILDDFDDQGRKVCCKVSLYKNCQRQSCSAINCLSSGINILAGGRPLPPEILPAMTCPLLSMVSYGRCQNITQERIAVGSSNFVEGLTT